MLRANLPERNAPCEPSRMGVGDVKVVFQPRPSGCVPVKDRDPSRAAVDPAPKLLIPSLNLKYSGGLRALGEKQELLVEGKLIVPAGRGEKLLPFLRRCDCLPYALIQLRDQLVSSCHRLRLLSLQFCVLPLPGNGKPVDSGDVVAQPAGHPRNIGTGRRSVV